MFPDQVRVMYAQQKLTWYREQPPLGTETGDRAFLALLELLFCLLVEAL